MTTLVEFLLARITETERAILNYWDSDGKARVATMWTGGEPGYATVASDHADEVWIADGREVEDPRHVRVLFDPARVLAECEARRETIRLLSQLGGHYQPEANRVVPQVFRTLALPYADHPDYREEWRP